jgi:glutamyl/glutaminyl-tRNA synthetase
VEDGINDLKLSIFVLSTKPILNQAAEKLIMTELLYKCNCSKAQATFALRRDLVRKQRRSCSRSDEDIETIKPAYGTPSQGGRFPDDSSTLSK